MTFGGEPPAAVLDEGGPVFGPEPPAAPSSPPAAPASPVVGARQLFGASFELLMAAGRAMRPASFYVGLVVLGTVGPLVLALLAVASVADLDVLFGPAVFDPEAPVPELPVSPAASGWLLVLVLVALAGILAASIESSAVAIAVLGSHLAGRPVTTREAIARSRLAFWWLVVAGIVLAIPTMIVQTAIEAAIPSLEASSVIGLVAAVIIQAPFVYATSGIVLGGVGPLEAYRRSVAVFRARKMAGLLVTLFPVLFQFVLVFGLGVGLDVIARVVTALGLDIHSGTPAVALIVVLSVMATFSVGTLLFTAAALSVAPQVVMFVGLTQATIGLDSVRPGGPNDPSHPSAGQATFRWLTRPMVLGFVLGGLALAAFVASFEV